MAKHKAPTQVTIVPTEERRGFGLWVERYWKMGMAGGLVIAIAILALQYTRDQARGAEVGTWSTLNATVLNGDPAEIKEVAISLEGSPAGAWAWASLAQTYAHEREYTEATAALSEIRSRHPENFLANERFTFGDDNTPRSLAEQASRNYHDWAAWEAENASLFENPPLPPDAPRVRMRTDRGDILLGLYSEKAPLHVENFLKLCGEGYYDNTAFHRIIRHFMIQGGDPNSREGDPDTWGSGGPDEGVPPETNDLKHFRGVLAGAKVDPRGDSSGSQFYITVDPSHHLDAQYTCFGLVLEGMDVVDGISEDEIADGTADRPAVGVRVLGTDIL